MANFLHSFSDRFNLNLSTPLETRFEWSVVMFGIGIALYFALPFEPALWMVTLSVVIAVILSVHFKRNIPIGSTGFIFLLMLCGLFRAAWHTHSIDAPILPNFERAYTVSGLVTRVEKSGSRLRWQIKVSEIEGLASDETPVYIRTTVSPGAFKPGDSIKIKAILSAPPGPAVPGGYNPGRRAYFQQIGGYGFSIGKPEAAPITTLSLSDKIQRSVVRFRFGIADRIMAVAPPETAGLQVALLTGIRTYISDTQTDALRAAGLAHILAISGLHMGLIAGSTFYVLTLLLACILPLSRRMDVRKLAAIIGALAATAYLILSGASVATQRAYIMALIVFLAVILDRRAFSMRSVALAAVITLLWHPEALMSAGFQMSFSAVAALIVVYREWDKRRAEFSYKPGLLRRGRSAITTLSVTSTVAGFATSGFAVLHFNRMANYGLIGNLLAMPIFTFWVMPSAIVVFLSLPFGLEAYPLAFMSKGIELLLVISNWVADLKGAVVHIAAAPNWVTALYAFGFAALCLGPNRLRYGGVALILACVVAWAFTPQPDMRISDKGAIAIWSDKTPNTLIVERKNTDRYGREQFIRRSGYADSLFETYSAPEALCDARACRLNIKDKSISITSYPSEIIEECEHSDLVVLTRRNAGPIGRRTCKSVLIDGQMLRSSGAQNIYLNGNDIRHESAVTPALKARPWGRRL